MNMSKLVLLRHGESIWNKKNGFTGWTDVDLSKKGIEEAKRAVIVLKENSKDAIKEIEDMMEELRKKGLILVIKRT